MIFKLLLVVAVGALVTGDENAASGDVSGRIIGGTSPQIEETPWMASLQTRVYPPTNVCSCTIISANWVVTAASCLDGVTNEFYRLRANTEKLNYEGGLHDLARIITHPDFNDVTHDNDIAVILVSPAIYITGASAKPIELPPPGFEPSTGTNMILAGWGATQENGANYVFIQKAIVPIVDRQICNDQYSEFGGITENQICAGGVAGVGGCTGDSGSSLTVQYQLEGLSSWGVGCGDVDHPYVYTKVSNYREWILQITGV